MSLINKGPSIMVVNNDEEAINLINNISDNNFTNIADALSWISSQDDIFIQNKTHEDIVIDGLVLYLDASNVESYPKGENIWYDLSGNENNATLLNELTYSNDGNGALIFDGSNDYIDVFGNFSPENTTDGITVEYVYKKNNVHDAVFLGNVDLTNGWFQSPISSTSSLGAYFYTTDSGVILRTNANFYTNTNNINTYHHVVMSIKWEDPANSFIFIDGNDVTDYKISAPKPSNKGSSNLRLGRRGSSIWPFNGYLSVVKYYNRSLTESEILKNYNALKHRYSIVFGYDLQDTVNSYKGEPTTNLITDIISYYGGNVSYTRGNHTYYTSYINENIIDNTAPGGKYSVVVGTTDSSNNQTNWYVSSVIDASGLVMTISVWLKGTGTCHLDMYDGTSGYRTSPTITLTNQWEFYSLTSTYSTSFTSSAWAGIRGIYTTTTVYIANAQIEIKPHPTPFINGTRNNTQGLLDLMGNNTIDLSNVSFNSNAQMIFDGTDDKISGNFYPVIDDNTTPRTWEIVVKPNTTHSSPTAIFGHSSSIGCSYFCNGGIYIYNGNWTFNWYDNSVYRWLSSNISATPDLYYHIITTFDINGLKIYINGDLKNTYGVTQLNYGSGGVLYSIGAHMYSKHYFNGEIPVAKFYKSSFTIDEVKYNYDVFKNRYDF